MSGAAKVMPCFQSIQPTLRRFRRRTLRNERILFELEAYLEEYPGKAATLQEQG